MLESLAQRSWWRNPSLPGCGYAEWGTSIAREGRPHLRNSLCKIKERKITGVCPS
jgi:hypothetical protein